MNFDEFTADDLPPVLMSLIVFLAFLLLLASTGCSSPGHAAYRGPEHMKDPVLANIRAGAACAAGGIGRPFDEARDTMTVEVRPGTGYNQFWWGVDEWGRQVGGYLQLLRPWPVPAGYAGPYALKAVLFANPSGEPLVPDSGVILHECGGHGNLVPSGIFEHPSRFKACYPWWRLKADEEYEEEAIGQSVIYGPDGQVLHECGPYAGGEVE